MCKVSIVLPVYNGEKYLRESLDSIMCQTFHDWELIVVNDCSTDNTLDIVNNYARKDDRITVINNDVNKKLPKSLNIGFRHARGEYLTWTSDDNIYLKYALEKMVDYLDNHNEMFVCAGMKSIDETGRVFSEWGPYSDNYLYYNNCVGACFMYRHDVINTIGEYDDKWFLVEDYEYWLRILTYYGAIGYIDEILYLYRFHNGSLTNTRKKEIRMQLLRLRTKYLNAILNNYKNGNYYYLTRIYIDYLLNESDDFNDALLAIQNKWKSLSKLAVLKDEKNIIAYGAGKIGDKAFEMLGNRIELYADRKNDKYGYFKNGIKIIHPSEIMDNIKNRNLLVTMTYEKVYELLIDETLSQVEKIYILDWDM